MMNVSRDLEVEAAKWTDMPQKIEAARERLLVVSAGNPRHRVRELAFAAQVKLGNVHHAMGWQLSDMLTHKDNLEWVDIYRKAHAEAETTMRELIDANFAWGYLPKRWVALARRDDQGGNETAPAVTTSPPGEGRRPQHRQVAGSADGLRSRFGRRRELIHGRRLSAADRRAPDTGTGSDSADANQAATARGAAAKTAVDHRCKTPCRSAPSSGTRARIVSASAGL